MLKNALVLFFLFCLFSSGFASIYLIKPVEKTIESNDLVELGSVEAGQTIELVLDSKTGYGSDFRWTDAKIMDSSLPSGWSAENAEAENKTMAAKVFVPASAENGAYNFVVQLIDLTEGISYEQFNARVFVEKNLLTASLSNAVQETVVGEPTKFSLVLSNQSVAKNTVIISSSLPLQWFPQKTYVIDGSKTETIELVVLPRVYGVKEFSFFVDSDSTGKRISSFDAGLSIKPTLKGKYSDAFYGLPFFTPSLNVFYLVNAFISLLL